jgi:hypothetical protein
LFRAGDLEIARHLLEPMFCLGPAPASGAPAVLKTKVWLWLVGLLVAVWSLPNVAEMVHQHQPYREVPEDSLPPGRWWWWRMNPAWAWLAAVLLAVSVLGLSRAGEFLYYNF